MGGRLPLTMHGASIGSSRSPETPTRRGNWNGPRGDAGVAANALPRAIARACRGFEAAPGPAEKSLCHQNVSRGRPPPGLLLGGALHKSQRGR